MTAFVKSGEARCGSLAIQYRYAAGSPRPANIATTGGQRTTTSRSPRPAGPRARAPIRLETTVDRMIVTSVMMISLALRAITSYSIPKNVELATECSACAARQDDGGYGAKQNRSIESQRPTVDVFEIQLHPLFKRKVAATGNLPQASYAGLHTKAPFLPRQFHSHRIAHRQRARADNAHVAEQHVDQLRQLIDAGLAQPTTGARDPRIVGILKIGPVFSFRCSSSSWPASASRRIVRNFSMRNRRLFRPTRSCTKRIGPSESSLMAIAAITSRGAKTNSRMIAETRSKMRLASVRQLNNGALCIETIGTPSKSIDCDRASFCGKRSDNMCVVIPCSSSINTTVSICVY